MKKAALRLRVKITNYHIIHLSFSPSPTRNRSIGVSIFYLKVGDASFMETV